MSAARRIWLVSISALLSSACGTGDREAEAERAPPAVEDTVFGDTVGAIDKANAVQDTVDAHKQDMDRRLDEGETAH